MSKKSSQAVVSMLGMLAGLGFSMPNTIPTRTPKRIRLHPSMTRPEAYRAVRRLERPAIEQLAASKDGRMDGEEADAFLIRMRLRHAAHDWLKRNPE